LGASAVAGQRARQLSAKPLGGVMAEFVHDEGDPPRSFPTEVVAEVSDLGIADFTIAHLQSENIRAKIEPTKFLAGVPSAYRILVPPEEMRRARLILREADLTEQELAYLATGELTGQLSREPLGGVARSMSLLSQMRDLNRHSGARAYNQARLSFLILSPVFIAFGILGLLGIGETRVIGNPVVGWDRLAGNLFFLGLGVALGIARFTLFRHRREHK
jgi:hypothetical protein